MCSIAAIQGTTMRLMTGLLAAQRFFSVLTGDQYLRRRPMKRVVEPLARMGARIWGRDGGERALLWPFRALPCRELNIARPLPVPRSSQPCCLAGLYAQG
jgi:3-phosphoshikimate 1-carboxyvinyltransferase